MTNERGYVVKEDYGEFIAVNGHSLVSKKSENTASWRFAQGQKV